MLLPVKRRFLIPAVAVALALSACAGDGQPAASETETGTENEVEPEPSDGADAGTVLFGDDQEPLVLNGLLLDGASEATGQVFYQVYPGAYAVQSDFTFQPWLLDGEAVVTEDPFAVTYTIRDDAVWSDGTPITADDLVFTWMLYDPAAPHADQIVSRAGYELVVDHAVEDDKTVTFTFSEPYAPWKSLFANVLPAHVFEGEDFATVLNDGMPPVSGGPFVFDSWDRGTQLKLVANEAYWDGEVGVDELIFRYVPDSSTLQQQLAGGEVDVADPQPQLDLVEELERSSDLLTYETGFGPVWEHIDFNTAVAGLDRDYVRRAIALGIDRERIVDTLIRDVTPDAEVLDNPFWMANSDNYEPAFARYGHDPEAAVALLEENGCTRGDDGIFVCDGTRLAYRITTMNGNERRELTEQLVQDDLAQIGVEITIANIDGAQFGELMRTPDDCGGACDYDLVLFAWVGSTDPSGNANIYGCDEGAPRPQNATGYCSDEVTALMDEANRTVDVDANAQLWNDAAEAMAADVPILPLFQQPLLMTWNRSLEGPQLNPAAQTQAWNAGTWSWVS
ncbi:MAG TPA: ABC transporter family substrate-binding protein [Egicoccus sp.]|nr:ABC transporter family substrate-binding protein [Egicoccus sp.]HSK24398.1 ABC transporter family substrate-binding protein [Egicoccus sp.]